MNPIVQFEREFQLWMYSVSHGQLLLRSTKDEKFQTQVDVLFKNVSFIQIPVLFAGLVISEVRKEEFQALNLSPGLLSILERRCFKLEGETWRGLIVAGNICWSEDDAEHFAESKLVA